MEINRDLKFHIFGFLSNDGNFGPITFYVKKISTIEELIQTGKSRLHISTSPPFLIYFLNGSGHLILLNTIFQIMEILAPNCKAEKIIPTIVLKPEIGVFVRLIVVFKDTSLHNYYLQKYSERIVMINTNLIWINTDLTWIKQFQSLEDIIGIIHESTLQIKDVTDVTSTIRYTCSQSIRSGDTLLLHIIKIESNTIESITRDNINISQIQSNNNIDKTSTFSPPSSRSRSEKKTEGKKEESIKEQHLSLLKPTTTTYANNSPTSNSLPTTTYKQPLNQVLPFQNINNNLNDNLLPSSPLNQPIIRKESLSPNFIYTSQIHQSIYNTFNQIDITLTKVGLNYLYGMCDSAEDAADLYYDKGQEWFLRNNYILVNDNNNLLVNQLDNKNEYHSNNLSSSLTTNDNNDNNNNISSYNEEDWIVVKSHKNLTSNNPNKSMNKEGNNSNHSPMIPSATSSTSKFGSPIRSNNNLYLTGNTSGASSNLPSLISKNKSTANNNSIAIDLEEADKTPVLRKPEQLQRSTSNTAAYQEQLLNMGYSLSNIKNALLRSSSLEAAIDYLESQSSSGGGTGGEGGGGLRDVENKDDKEIRDQDLEHYFDNKLGPLNNNTNHSQVAGIVGIEPVIAKQLECLACVSLSIYRRNPSTECILTGCLLNHSFCCDHYLAEFNRNYLKKNSSLLPCCLYIGTEVDDDRCGYTMTVEDIQNILQKLENVVDYEALTKLKSIFKLIYRVNEHRQRAEFWCKECAGGEEDPITWYRSQTSLKSFSDENCWFTMPIDDNRQCLRCPRCLSCYCARCGNSPFHYDSKCETLIPLTLFWRNWLTEQKAIGKISAKRFNKLFPAATSRLNAMEDMHRKRCQPDIYRQCPTCQRVIIKTTHSNVTICGITIEVSNQVKVLDGCGTTFDWSAAYPLNPKLPTKHTLLGYDSKVTPTALLRVHHKVMCTVCKMRITGYRLDCVFCNNITLCSDCCLDPARIICKDDHIFKVKNKAIDESSSVHKTNE